LESTRIWNRYWRNIHRFRVIYPGTQRVMLSKLLSTPSNPASAIMEGLSRIDDVIYSSDAGRKADSIHRIIVHGSTVATNALLERKGVQTALIAREGFVMYCKLVAKNRPSLYDLYADPPPPLVSRENRLEVDERVDHKRCGAAKP